MVDINVEDLRSKRNEYIAYQQKKELEEIEKSIRDTIQPCKLAMISDFMKYGYFKENNLKCQKHFSRISNENLRILNSKYKNICFRNDYWYNHEVKFQFRISESFYVNEKK